VNKHFPRECPLLKKFYISIQEEDWEKTVCLNCPISPICVLELEGRTPRILKEKLKETNIPCPKCRNDPVVWKEVIEGVRPSTLEKNKDGDWECFLCGFIIYSATYKED